MTKMNPDVKSRWVAALRSGEYKQGTTELRSSEDKFCCLGVLCNIHAQEHPEIAAEQRYQNEYMGHAFLPPPEVGEWADLDVESALVLIGGFTRQLYLHNDDGCSFAEIADAIEEQL